MFALMCEREAKVCTLHDTAVYACATVLTDWHRLVLPGCTASTAMTWRRRTMLEETPATHSSHAMPLREIQRRPLQHAVPYGPEGAAGQRLTAEQMAWPASLGVAASWPFTACGPF